MSDVEIIQSAYFDGVEDQMLGLRDMFETQLGKNWMLGEDFSAWELSESKPQELIEFVQDIGDILYKHYKDELPKDKDVLLDLVYGES